MKISILIPCYNEQDTIVEIVDRVIKSPLPFEKEIVIVDDGSTDNTRNILETTIKPKVTKIILQPKNQGKGAAINIGLRAVTGDILIIQDADLEYDPQDYPSLIEPILNNKAEVVYGSRFLGGRGGRVLYFWHSMGNKMLTFLSNMMTNLNLTDMETCYKVFTKKIYSQITITENRFGMEPEITAKIAKLRPIIYEVGIHYHGRTYEEGKKITWIDGLRALWCIAKYRFF